MEKDYEDYAWNLNKAAYWYRRIGRHKLAELYHQGHLKIANTILAKYKRTKS